MRRGPYLACSLFTALVLASCNRSPLPAEAPGRPDGGGGGGGSAGEGGTDAAASPVPRPLDWGIPIGTPAAGGGYTRVAAVVSLDDGGAIVAGDFVGSVTFGPDTTLVADGTSAGFLARYRRDQRLVWARSIGAPNGRVVIADMAGKGDGTVAVAGRFEGMLTCDVLADDGIHHTVLSNAGGLDVFVARFAPDGSVRWAVRAGGPGDDIARAISGRWDRAGGGTIAITGATGAGALFGEDQRPPLPAPQGNGPIFVARLGDDGIFHWVRFVSSEMPAPGSDDMPAGFGVTLDETGAVAATGYVNGAASFGTDRSGNEVTVDARVGRGFVARWSSSGALEWARALAGPKGEGDVITVGPAGELIASGLFVDEARFGEGDAAPTLVTDVPGQPGTFLAAFDAAGATLWARRLAGGAVRPWHLHTDADDGLLVAASFAAGALVDPDGAQPLRVFSLGASDALFMRLASDGLLGWATAGGGAGADTAVDLAAASGGTTWAVGNYAGPAAFGAGSVFGAGASVTLESDTAGGAFLLRLHPATEP